MVSIAVSKMGMTELIFVVPRMRVNGQYYGDVLLSQQMLPAIKHVASDTCVFQQRVSFLETEVCFPFLHLLGYFYAFFC